VLNVTDQKQRSFVSMVQLCGFWQRTINSTRDNRQGGGAFMSRDSGSVVIEGERFDLIPYACRGGDARKRNVETAGDLTPQEMQAAQLARDGLSRSEISVRLFINLVPWNTTYTKSSRN
jgi:hypothetical protein